MKALLLLLLAGCAPGCAAHPDATLVPMGDFRGIAVRVTPPRPQWLAGYAGAEVCSGRKGDVRRIRWHIVPDSTFVVAGLTVIGYADGLDIYLAAPHAANVWLARHEALHTLGFLDHPTAVFGRCKAYYPTVSEGL
jgi:hypothetical protein